MTIDDFTKIATSIIGILNAVAWPIVAACLIRKFSPLIRDFLANMTEGSVKAFGVEATAKRNAAIDIAKADLIKFPASADSADIASQAANSIRSAEAVTNSIDLKRVAGRSVLWIDDRPEDTFYERNALIQLGMRMDIATAPDDAFRLFKTISYDVAVIVPRHVLPESKRLIEAIIASGVPYILYGQPDRDDAVSQASAEAAVATVSRASELTAAVARHLGQMDRSDSMQSYVSWAQHYEALKKLAEETPK